MSEGFIRPEAKVLPKESLVPPESLIHPPPNRFTHEVRRRQPFSYGDTAAAPADGELERGAKVVLLVRHRGDACRVVDAQGRYVRTAFSGLRPLTHQPE